MEHRAARKKAATAATRRAPRAATSPYRRWTTSPTCARQDVTDPGRCGPEVERAHYEVGTAGQAEINYKFGTLLHAADQVMLFKYVIKNAVWDAGLTATSCPLSHSSATTGLGLPPPVTVGRTAAVVLRRARLCRSVRPRSLVHRWLRLHAPSPLAFTNPDGELLPPTGAGLRGSGQPGALFSAQPFGLHSHPDHREQPEGQAARVPRSGPVEQPVLAFSPMLMAGLDGIKNKIEPVDPVLS